MMALMKTQFEKVQPHPEPERISVNEGVGMCLKVIDNWTMEQSRKMLRDHGDLKTWF
jgi:hypothetical protein